MVLLVEGYHPYGIGRLEILRMQFIDFSNVSNSEVTFLPSM